MKKTKKIFIVAVAMMMLVCVSSSIKVSAASSKASYSAKKTDLSKNFSDGKGHSIKLKYYYNRISLKGNTPAIKKINKKLKAYSDKFMSTSEKKSNYKYVKDSLKDYSGQTFINTVNTKVVYNKNGMISISVKEEWFAGGVDNIDVYGYTFRLKDAKLLKITDVCSTNESKLQNDIWSKAKTANIFYSDPNFNKSKIVLSKTNFYVKSDNQVVVCFRITETGNLAASTININRKETTSGKKASSNLADGWYSSALDSKSQAKKDSLAKKYGFIYKMEIKGSKLVIYGSFSKDNKKYSSKKREFVISPSCKKDGLSKNIINSIKIHKTLSDFFGFQLKNNKVALLTLAS